MDKISGQNSVIWFFAQYRKNSQKFSKKAITRLQRPLGRNPFRVLLVSLRPPCGHNMSSNGGCHLEWFPREFFFHRFFTKNRLFFVFFDEKYVFSTYEQA